MSDKENTAAAQVGEQHDNTIVAQAARMLRYGGYKSEPKIADALMAELNATIECCAQVAAIKLMALGHPELATPVEAAIRKLKDE